MLQTIVGGLFGSLGFIANMLVIKYIYGIYQKSKAAGQDAPRHAEPVNRMERRFLNRKQRV